MSFGTGVAVGFAMGKKMFESGGEEQDEYWEKWLNLPEPDSNQIIFFTKTVTDENYTNTILVIPSLSNNETVYPIGFAVDWGDGDREMFPSNTVKVSHVYSHKGEYVVKFTNACGVNSFASASTGTLMIKYGDNMFPTGRRLQGYHSLQYVKLPAQAAINCDYFFMNCKNLKRIEYGGIISALYKNMFSNCYELNFSNLKFGDITEIPEACFGNCYSLTAISFKNCTVVNKNAFSGCVKLKTVDLPNCTKIADYNAFLNCYNLQSIDMPNCITVGQNSFGNSGVVTVNMPNCTTVSQQGFYNCWRLTKTVFANQCTFGYQCFANCFNLYPRPDGSKN